MSQPTMCAACAKPSEHEIHDHTGPNAFYLSYGGIRVHPFVQPAARSPEGAEDFTKPCPSCHRFTNIFCHKAWHDRRALWMDAAPRSTEGAPPREGDVLCVCGHRRGDHFRQSPMPCDVRYCACSGFAPAAPEGAAPPRCESMFYSWPCDYTRGHAGHCHYTDPAIRAAAPRSPAGEAPANPRHAPCASCGHVRLMHIGDRHCVTETEYRSGEPCECVEFRAAPVEEARTPEPNTDSEFLLNMAGHFWQRDRDCTSILAKGCSALQAARFERIASRLRSLTEEVAAYREAKRFALDAQERAAEIESRATPRTP